MKCFSAAGKGEDTRFNDATLLLNDFVMPELFQNTEFGALRQQKAVEIWNLTDQMVRHT